MNDFNKKILERKMNCPYKNSEDGTCTAANNGIGCDTTEFHICEAIFQAHSERKPGAPIPRLVDVLVNQQVDVLEHICKATGENGVVAITKEALTQDSHTCMSVTTLTMRLLTRCGYWRKVGKDNYRITGKITVYRACVGAIMGKGNTGKVKDGRKLALLLAYPEGAEMADFSDNSIGIVNRKDGKCPLRSENDLLCTAAGTDVKCASVGNLVCGALCCAYEKGWAAARDSLHDEYSDSEKAKARRTPIEDMDFSVRSYHCLCRAGLKTMGDVADFPHLSRIRNLGQKSLAEVLEKLASIGLTGSR